MRQFSQAEVINKLARYRPENDGSITSDCPVCELEKAGKGKDKLKVFSEGNIVCLRFKGLGDAGEHLKAVHEALGLDVPIKVSAFIEEQIFDGQLTIQINPAERNCQRVIARNRTEILNCDELNLHKAVARASFVDGLAGFSDFEKTKIASTLVQLVDRFDRAFAATRQAEQKEVEYIAFKVFEDNAILEQISTGFALYQPAKKSVTKLKELSLEGVTYRPFIDGGAVRFADDLAEYDSDEKLDEEIERYIYRHLDLSDRDRRLAARYIRFSYIADRVLELSYLRPIGPRGNGKSRYIQVVGGICYRPFIVISPSPASIFRLVDRYRCTLAIDEANWVDDADTAEIIKLLNSGFQRGNFVPRVEPGPEGQFIVRTYDPFGPKLIASIKPAESNAFESRCIRAEMAVTKRNDIKLRLSQKLLLEQAELRAKLTLWRLRNYHHDFESLLDAAELELRQCRIEPRYVQIACTLYMLIRDSELKKEFTLMLEGRTTRDAADARDELDGQLTQAIYDLLFETVDPEADRPVMKLRAPPGVSPPEPDKPCELLPIIKITEVVNKDLPEKRQYDSKWVGKQVKKLGLETAQINVRASEFRGKAAVVFDPKALIKLFERYSLPSFPDFDPAISSQYKNSNDSNKLDWLDRDKKIEAVFGDPATPNSNTDGNLKDWLDVAGSRIRKAGTFSQNEVQGELEEARAPAPTIVALDTETEPFDRRRGITPQNCRMRGLAVSYDGEKADYVVDPEAWPLLMPDPELPVIMHNAKFDLAVLDRTGLPQPVKFEDTLIAAHLIDEAGEHGLKPLARRVLGIADPITFEEGDRLRMLDPEVFNEYARNDASYTYRLWQRFSPELERQGLTTVYNMEKALVGVVLAMEQAGLKVDLLLIHQLLDETRADAEGFKAQLFELAGCEFDVDSTRKMAAILYDKLGLPCTKRTANGQRSVDHEALKSIRGTNPVIEAVLRYRELDKLAGTFLKVLPKYADNRGRIHPEYKPLGAVSGRMTCTNPNVQQIPSRTELGKRLRRAFIAEEGHKLVVADFNQMELRVLAHFSEDQLLLDAYTSTGTDLHALTASKIFGRPMGDVTKAQRAIAKMINFGIAYGITAPGLASRLRQLGVDVSETQCETFIADYFKTYPGVSRFLDLARKAAQARGYVKSLMGRRRRLAAVDARESRQVQNHIIQASAADLAKDAMIRLHNVLPCDARLVGMIHDEFIVECRENDAGVVMELMKGTMQQKPPGFKVPLLVDAHVSDNWGDAK